MAQAANFFWSPETVEECWTAPALVFELRSQAPAVHASPALVGEHVVAVSTVGAAPAPAVESNTFHSASVVLLCASTSSKWALQQLPACPRQRTPLQPLLSENNTSGPTSGATAHVVEYIARRSAKILSECTKREFKNGKVKTRQHSFDTSKYVARTF